MKRGESTPAPGSLSTIIPPSSGSISPFPSLCEHYSSSYRTTVSHGAAPSDGVAVGRPVSSLWGGRLGALLAAVIKKLGRPVGQGGRCRGWSATCSLCQRWPRVRYATVSSILGWSADNGALVQAIAEGQRPDNLLAFLATELQEARFPQGLLEECAEVLGLEYSNELIRSVTPTNPTLRLGYFGEMVAATCLRDFDGCWIVVPKPSFAIDPNQSLPGTDVLAAFLNGGEIECLVFVEAKVRTSRSRSVVLQAARQSISDSQHAYASMIGFVVRRLYESHDQMHGPFLRYLGRRHDGASDDLPFVYLVLERGAWSDDDVDLLDDLAPLPQGVSGIHSGNREAG